VFGAICGKLRHCKSTSGEYTPKGRDVARDQ
jgi:hypothetical protein